MSVTAFIKGDAVFVDTRGAGNLHLLSYNSNAGIPAHIGIIPTKARHTRFLISHSYTFEAFAFYWDGASPACVRIGKEGKGGSEGRAGNSWANASVVKWQGKQIETADVRTVAAQSVARDLMVTAFIV